jgi:hypothetical protein
MTVTQMIDKALVGHDLTIEQAADQAGVSRQSLYLLRRGGPVSRDTVRKVANALQIDRVELWTAMNESTEKSAA